MIVFCENSKPVIIDQLYTPLVNSHIWVLDMDMEDFIITPLKVLQEIVCPTIILEVDGLDIPVPANWYVLIYDEETTMLDVVKINELAGRPFRLFRYGFSDSIVGSEKYKTKSYLPQYPNIVPHLSKKQMLCHPINDKQWICVASTDAFCKKLKDMTVGDLT